MKRQREAILFYKWFAASPIFRRNLSLGYYLYDTSNSVTLLGWKDTSILAAWLQRLGLRWLEGQRGADRPILAEDNYREKVEMNNEQQSFR